VTVRVTVSMEGGTAIEQIEIPLPTLPPPVAEGGGGWAWKGPLPKDIDVPLGGGISLSLRLIHTDSVAARVQTRARRGGKLRHPGSLSKPPEKPPRCPWCGKEVLGKQGLAPHQKVCPKRPKAKHPGKFKCPKCTFTSTVERGISRHLHQTHGVTKGGKAEEAPPPLEPPAHKGRKPVPGKLTLNHIVDATTAWIRGGSVSAYARSTGLNHELLNTIVTQVVKELGVERHQGVIAPLWLVEKWNGLRPSEQLELAQRAIDRPNRPGSGIAPSVATSTEPKS
jgi:hypothetical protein